MITPPRTLGTLFATVAFSFIVLGTASARQELLVGGYDPKQWQVGHEASSQSQSVTEFVRSGETIKNWTELLTLQVLRKPGYPEPIDALVAKMHQEISSRCPAVKWSVVSRSASSDAEEAGMLYEWSIKSCAPEPDQHEIGRVIYGKFSIFRIAYAAKTSTARLYRLAAEQGDAQGQFNLGSMYANGEGGLAKDSVEAVRLIRLSAGQGNARAQTALGLMYANGTGGLSKDDAQAVRLFQLAADQGASMAQNNLGFMYEKGRGGLTADLETAVSWYRMSAAQGERLAIANLRQLGRQ